MQRQRLRNDDFQRLRREGRVYSHRFLTLSLAPNQRSYNRYGFVVGRQLGKAVVRNRVRRLMREAIRLHGPQIHTGYDIVLIARRPLVGQPFAVVLRIVSDLLHQAGVVESDLSS